MIYGESVFSCLRFQAGGRFQKRSGSRPNSVVARKQPGTIRTRKRVVPTLRGSIARWNDAGTDSVFDVVLASCVAVLYPLNQHHLITMVELRETDSGTPIGIRIDYFTHGMKALAVMNQFNRNCGSTCKQIVRINVTSAQTDVGVFPAIALPKERSPAKTIATNGDLGQRRTLSLAITGIGRQNPRTLPNINCELKCSFVWCACLLCEPLQTGAPFLRPRVFYHSLSPVTVDEPLPKSGCMQRLRGARQNFLSGCGCAFVDNLFHPITHALPFARARLPDSLQPFLKLGDDGRVKFRSIQPILA